MVQNIEIEKRIKSTWNKYCGLNDIFKSNLPQAIKTKVMNSSLLPCLTYGCQTWKFTAETRKKISVCQRGLERSIRIIPIVLCIFSYDFQYNYAL